MKKFCFVVLWFLALVWIGGLLWFITEIPGAPSKAQEADAIVVLTGGPLRIDHGFELLTSGRAPQLFISGVENGVTLPLLLHKKEYHSFANLIAPERVTLGYKAHSTSGNAEETALWLAGIHAHSILLVTGNYHIPRSTYELEQAVPGLTIIPEPVFLGYFNHTNWRSDWQGWLEGSRLVVSEYCKYLASVALHTWSHT